MHLAMFCAGPQVRHAERDAFRAAAAAADFHEGVTAFLEEHPAAELKSVFPRLRALTFACALHKYLVKLP